MLNDFWAALHMGAERIFHKGEGNQFLEKGGGGG
jgi:hypothetical protein